jgi:hypothetical protein
MRDKKVIQQEAENVAYTSKGLFKTADWLKNQYKICIFASFSIGLILLGFNIPVSLSKALGIVSIMTGIILLIGEKEFKKNEQYYELANRYLGIYKDLQEIYYKGENSEKLSNLRKQIKKLDEKTSIYPISKVGRWWSRRVIKSEMNLDWIYENKDE